MQMIKETMREADTTEEPRRDRVMYVTGETGVIIIVINISTKRKI